MERELTIDRAGNRLADAAAMSLSPACSSLFEQTRLLRPSDAIRAAAIIALVAAGTAGTFNRLVSRWLSDPSSSHGFLVPFISLILVNEYLRNCRANSSTKRGAASSRIDLVLGAVAAFGSLVMNALTVFLPSLWLETLAIIGLLGSLTLLFGGRDSLRAAAGGLLFLGFMIPLPSALQASLSSPLQHVASAIAEPVITMAGIPVLREGNLLHLPGQTLLVAEACSGIRQLTAFIAMTTAGAILLQRPLWYRAVLMLAALPIAVLANCCRVTVLALLLNAGRQEFVDGPLHAAEGLLMILLGLFLLRGVVAVLDFLDGSAPRVAAVTEQTGRKVILSDIVTAMASPVQWQFAMIVLVMGLAGRAAMALQADRMLATTERTLAQPLAAFPYRLGVWTGTDLAPDPKLVSDIRIDSWLQRVYVHPAGDRVALWMSHSSKSADQYHYPTVCMAGSGWTEDESARTEQTVSIGDDQTLTMLRLRFTKPGTSQYVYYWYYLMGETPVDRWMRHGSRMARVFLRGRRNASVTIELFSQSPVHDPERLDAFARDIANQLQDHLPAGTTSECSLGADS